MKIFEKYEFLFLKTRTQPASFAVALQFSLELVAVEKSFAFLVKKKSHSITRFDSFQKVHFHSKMYLDPLSLAFCSYFEIFESSGWQISMSKEATGLQV